ncbi:hypothetical protein [Glycomyces tenuis]|uniref:hypothetical protein n=1 Tax=Glycomyces tenuis TaxID=58116 RepID=UPI00040F37D7|nr:hypothetical protein [Glycomyces tenuis]
MTAVQRSSVGLTPKAAKVVNAIKRGLDTGIWRRVSDRFGYGFEARRPVAGGIGDEHTRFSLRQHGRTVKPWYQGDAITLARALGIIADPYRFAAPVFGTDGDNPRPIDTRDPTMPVPEPLTAKICTNRLWACSIGRHGTDSDRFYESIDVQYHVSFLKRVYDIDLTDVFAEADEGLRYHCYRRTGPWQRRRDLDTEWDREVHLAPVAWVESFGDEFELWTADPAAGREPERIAFADTPADLAAQRAEAERSGAVTGIYQHLIAPEGLRLEYTRRNRDRSEACY